MLGAAVVLVGSAVGRPSAPSTSIADADPAAVEVACGASAPNTDPPPVFDRAPEITLRSDLDYRAIIHTSCGIVHIDLLEDQAPVAVNNFIYLARNGFYNGLVWHQVKHDFVIQTGDPDGRNGLPDGPGYAIPDELPKQKGPYTYGAMAMARRGGPDSGGSQFFISVHDLAGATSGAPQALAIPSHYTLFGRVEASSYPVTETIAMQLTTGGIDPILAAVPKVPIYVEWIEIIQGRQGRNQLGGPSGRVREG